MRKSVLLAAAFSLASVLLGTGPAHSEEPQAFAIGKAVVWAIADNTGDRDMGVFIADADTVKKYAPAGKTPSAVLCFLVRLGDATILIDTGNGNPPGDNRASLLMDGLRHVKVKPEEIDTVVITHMHGDHIGGLAWEGKPAFPNATVKVGRLERDFWLGDDVLRQFPDRQGNVDLAKKMMSLYKDKVEIFDFGAEVVPGLTAVDARGHTPGHTALLLESEGEKLLCIADLLHSAALQFPRPDINARYDMIPKWAIYTRQALLNRASWENLPVAGMHLPFPGIGRVKQDGPHGYAYQPGL